MYAWLIGAVVVAAMCAGSYIQGRGDGANGVQVRWDKANTAASAAVEADRKAQETKAVQSAKTYQKKLETQKLATRELTDALSRELAKKPLPADCVIPDVLRDDINAALSGPASRTAGGVLGTAGAAPPASVKPIR